MSDTEYTPEELASLPQTTAVFDQPKLVIDEHEWVQRGYMIEDNCRPKRANCLAIGAPIPTGKLLIKEKGRYKLVSEITRK